VASETSIESLVGTWQLAGWTFTVDGDRETEPWGGDTVGLITYTADGRMAVTLMRPGRPNAPTRTLSAAPARIRAAAAGGYLSYAGRYSVEDDRVIHHIEVSLMPNWVGGDEVRFVEWLDNGDGTRDLVLRTPPTKTDSGRMAINRLRWRRITNGVTP
jgi:hypothetical protein